MNDIPGNNDEDSGFNLAFGLNRLSLRLMGIWPIDETTRSRSKSLKTSLRVPFMIFIIFFGLFLPQMYALYLVIHELPLVIDNLLTSCPALTSCIKLYFVWHNAKVLERVMRSVQNDWLNRSKQPWELEAMKKEASRARLITIADYLIMSGCYCGFVVAPLLGFDLRLVNNITDYGQRHLLVQSYYPYDYSISPRFQLTHGLQLMGSFFIGLAVSVPDDYFGALVFHVSAQFHILGTHIRRLIDESNAPIANVSLAEDVDEKFRKFIREHVRLIKMVSEVEKSFSFVITAQIFCMSLMVCCLGFQILSMLNGTSEKPKPLQMITLTGTLLTMMIHTLVDCFASEILASYSADIFVHIYSSLWYVLPLRKRRCIIPMMLISKNPRQITAGHVMQMSLATYCGIIRSTAGYISVLIAASGR